MRAAPKTCVLLVRGFTLRLITVSRSFAETSTNLAHSVSGNPSHLKGKLFLSSCVGTLILLLNGLAFVGLVTARTGEQGIRVKIYARERTTYPETKTILLRGVTVKIGPYTVTTDGAGEASTVVSRGTHNVTAFLQGFIVADMSVYPDALGGQHGGGLAQSDEGDLDLPFLYNSSYEEAKEDSTLTVWMKAGVGQRKEREIALAAASEDCKDFNWEGAQVTFSPPAKVLPDGTRTLGLSQVGKDRYFRLSKYGLAEAKTELKPGTYDVHFTIPLFTDARISKVEVYRAFPRLELVGTHPADEKGFAAVPLDASLWKDASTPYVKVHVMKLCDLSYATIEFFQGNVEVTEDGSLPEPARAGMKLFRNTAIKTGPGSSVRLKTEGAIYVITIAESVHVNIGALITGEGRKFIEASIKSGQIEIKRVLFPEKPRPTSPDALPEPVPEGGMTVKTPTARVTDKQTAYTVGYDEKTNTTTVGVEEGEVEVTPTESSLKPFMLVANQKVEVTGLSVSAIGSLSRKGGGLADALLYAGIGLGGVLIVLGLMYFSRRQRRPTAQPHFQPTGVSTAGWNAPANAAPSVISESPQRCHDPRCGKLMPAGKKFCTSCGAPLRV